MNMRGNRQRGSNLATTILWIALVSTLGLVLAGISVQHLFTLTFQGNRQQAEWLARSATSLAIEKTAPILISIAPSSQAKF